MAKENKHSLELTIEELLKGAGFPEPEVELIVIKGDLLAHLAKRSRQLNMNQTEFAKYLSIPKSRLSSIYKDPDKVTVDYLLMLAGKCGMSFKLVPKTVA